MPQQNPTVPPSAEGGREGAKKAFLFYTNWYSDCAESLSEEDLGKFLVVIVRYASNGTLPDETTPAIVRSMFGLIRPAMDADIIKYEKAAEKKRKQSLARSQKLGKKSEARAVENQQETSNLPLIVNSELLIDNSKSLSEVKKKEEARPRFEEVEAYWRERQLKSCAREFYDYYESRGWVGCRGGQIQSWKRAALLWDDKFRRDVLPMRRREEAAAKAERRADLRRENERIRQQERLAREAEAETRAARAVDHQLGLYMYHRAVALCQGDEERAMRLTQQASTDPAVFERLREGYGGRPQTSPNPSEGGGLEVA